MDAQAQERKTVKPQNKIYVVVAKKKEPLKVEKKLPHKRKEIRRSKGHRKMRPRNEYRISFKERKAKLWKDLVKIIKAPKISSTKVLPNGDLIINPADEKTTKVLEAVK